MSDHPRGTKAAATLAFAALLAATSACATASGPPAPAQGMSDGAASYLARIRAESGLAALQPSPALEKAAREQAGYMAGSGRMRHSTGFGRDFSSRLRQNGIRGPAAENVAHGQQDLEALFAAWMKSSGHRSNMLGASYGHFGLAKSTGQDGRLYWALVLGP
ncbi:MAG: CAP domain-containing protein [Mesorhizobium sp.]|jgi:uncharacterized protein YkwD